VLERRIEIRWRDMDAYGHVNNAVYLNFLEEARDAWVLETLGAISDTWDFVLAHVEVDFLSELKQDDGAVLVRCTGASLGRSSIRTREEVAKLDGTTSARAAAVIVPRDPQTGRSRPLNEAEHALLEAALEPEETG
jgi:acyl-CoA thioester hydrolase